MPNLATIKDHHSARLRLERLKAFGIRSGAVGIAGRVHAELTALARAPVVEIGQHRKASGSSGGRIIVLREVGIFVEGIAGCLFGIHRNHGGWLHAKPCACHRLKLHRKACQHLRELGERWQLRPQL